MIDMKKATPIAMFTILAVWMIGFLFPNQGHAQTLTIVPLRGPLFVGDSVTLQVEANQLDANVKIKRAETETSDGLKISFDGASGLRRQTEIVNGRMVVNKVAQIFQYSISASKPGTYKIGPFQATHNGKVVASESIELEIFDIEVSDDMKVEIVVPAQKIYPGQRVPVKVIWKYSANVRALSSLAITSSLFDKFRFIDEPIPTNSNAISVVSSKGVVQIAAVANREDIDGTPFLTLTSTRTMVPDVSGAFKFPEPVANARIRVRNPNRSAFGFQMLEEKTIPIKAIGNPISFEVKPFPTKAKPDSFNGAVGNNFSIKTMVNRNKLRVGDPVSLQVNISGNGNTESLSMPDLREAFPADQFDLPSGDFAGVVSDDQKQFNVSVRIKKASVSEIPSLEFSWFDVEKENYVSVTAPPIPIEVSEGKFVSSNEVIRNALPSEIGGRRNDSFHLNDRNMVDLSIETDVAKLSVQTIASLPAYLPWCIYTIGVLLIGAAVFDFNRRKPPSESQVQLSSIRAVCAKISAISLDENTIESVSSALRELQVELPESSDVDTQIQIDKLVGECDAVSFRPGGDTDEERARLLHAAKKLSASIT
jgi:hypothetical protein